MQKIPFLLLIIVGLAVKAKAQKGEKILMAGLLIAPTGHSTTNYYGYEYFWGTGLGVEVTGQSNISDKGTLLLQLQLTAFRGSSNYTSLLHYPVVTPLTLKGGYRYRFTASGFYANALAGLEYADDEMYLPIAIGVGKRIVVRDIYFIDAGIDYTGGFVNRFNIKAIFSLLQKNPN